MYRIFSINNKLKNYIHADLKTVYQQLDTSDKGLDKQQVARHKKLYGNNKFHKVRLDSIGYRLCKALFNPFTILLYLIGIISIITEVLYPMGLHKNFVTVSIISVMILCSVIIRFVHEQRSKNAIAQIDTFFDNMVAVKREGRWQDIPVYDLVVGDYVHLVANTKVPADIRLTKVDNLFVSQAVLTGESDIVEKQTAPISKPNLAITKYDNIAFMGTSILSGRGEGIVVNVGTNTLYGSFAQNKSANLHNNFIKDANYIAWTMIKFMLILLPVVFIIAGLSHGDWLYSFLFSLSIAIGLTPELLPIIITICLAKGTSFLSKKKTIIKDINVMQSFGSMDILCVDKTGTLTKNNIILEYYLDILGNESSKVLDYAYLNSYHLSSTPNHIDMAILKYGTLESALQHYEDLVKKNRKLDEIPFDFTRKCASVVVDDGKRKLLITKGELHEICSKCGYIEYQGKVYKREDQSLDNVNQIVGEMLEDGMKIIAVAYKYFAEDENIMLETESNLVLLGYLAFFDAPKSSALQAIEKLQELNVNVKLLTGDNAEVASSICKRVGINNEQVIRGYDIDNFTEEQLCIAIEKNNIFAELTPAQKMQIVTKLRQNGHTVGFLGDGLNDIPAIVEADVGISVETATASTKDVADVILLQKDLTILQDAILEGRKTFINMTKYIKITASSNFGNIFSILCASAFLPFLPMTAIQLLLLNILYDVLCFVLPWDHTDKEDSHLPHAWHNKHLGRFMCFFGPISSFFDIVTFLFLYFVFCPSFTDGLVYSQLIDVQQQNHYIALFQSGWFLESMWSQILILQMLRTKKLPFIKSNASKPVWCVILLGIGGFSLLTFTPLAKLFGLTNLSMEYFAFLLLIVLLYMVVISIAKYIYMKKYQELL